MLYGFTRRLYGAGVAGWAVLTLNVIPIFQAGSLLMTIDPLSIFFWAGAMVACWLALERRRVRLPYWLLAGVCVGLGFLSKYTNAMELVVHRAGDGLGAALAAGVPARGVLR